MALLWYLAAPRGDECPLESSRPGRQQRCWDISILPAHPQNQHPMCMEEVSLIFPRVFHLYPLSSSSSLKCIRWSGMGVEKRRKSLRHLFLSPSLCKNTSEHPRAAWTINCKTEICRPAALLVFCITVRMPKQKAHVRVPGSSAG